MSLEISDQQEDLPDHLVRFPCMMPWVGDNYPAAKTRLAIVAESHYLPDNACTDINRDPGDKWYESCQCDLPSTAIHEGKTVNVLNWINTCHCVENYDKPEYKNSTYPRVAEAIQDFCTFEDISFFNYIFRPVYESPKKGYSANPLFKVRDADRCTSAKIMRWFICEHKPTDIIIASSIVLKYCGIQRVLDEYPDIRRHEIHHPLERNKDVPNRPKFERDMQSFLRKIFPQPRPTRNLKMPSAGQG